MSINLRLSRSLCGRKNGLSRIYRSVMCRFYNTVPFLDLYERTTGDKIPEDYLPTLKKKHPNIDSLSHDRLQCTLQILRKFNIDELEACLNLHVFTMNPITMDNYGEILRECEFVKVLPQHIIKYHTIVRSRTIARLKKEGLLRDDLRLEKVIYDKLEEWPASCKTFENFSDSDTSILTVRTRILEKYLNWRISVTSEEFNKFIRNYLPLRHKPMSDIKEALDIAQNVIKFDVEGIKRNGFVISSDPVNTKLILKNVVRLAGLDIQEVIRMEPAILKNNYNALLQIRDILEEYRIPEDAQRRCFKVYCMNPNTVRERLDELSSLKEYRVLSTNPRVLTMVVHKKKMMNRLSKIQAAKKQCYSLNHLVSSNQIFNNYISSFGNKVCGRDIAILINSSLKINNANKPKTNIAKEVSMQLKKHKYWLHTALNAIDENIKFLKQRFNDEIILNNCHLLLYPVTEVKNHINNLLNIRSGTVKISDCRSTVDPYFNNIKHETLTDNQILSLVLYEIEKRYHFSGDGIWSRQDGVKTDTQLS